MDPLRIWRQYDSVKAAALLILSALLLVGYCIRSAVTYAEFLRTPIEYVCTAQNGISGVLPQLANAEGIRGYSLQKTAYLACEPQSVNVTMLSASYLSDCYSLADNGRTVYMNPLAFSEIFGEGSQSPAVFYGTLDGQPYSAQIVCTQELPQEEPFAAVAVGTAELRDADTLRICLTEQGSFSPTSLGLTIINTEVQCRAEYEQKLILLRIRFSALSSFLALLAALAFLNIFKLHRRSSR